MKDSARRFVLLKLSTDRYEASRGLFTTAELLVIHHLQCCHRLRKGATVLHIALTAQPRMNGLSY